MKLALVFCAALSFSALAGSTAVQRGPDTELQQDTSISIPAWLVLPDDEYVTRIEYTGEVGLESSRGAVTLELPSDGQAELVWLSAHFRAHGYQIEDHTSSLDQFGGTAGIVTAYDDATGRRLTIVNTPSTDGATLRISFEDPLVDAQV